MLLVRRLDHGERVAARTLAEPGGGRVGDRRGQQQLDACEPLGRQPQRVACVVVADG